MFLLCVFNVTKTKSSFGETGVHSLQINYLINKIWRLRIISLYPQKTYKFRKYVSQYPDYHTIEIFRGYYVLVYE